MKKEMDRNEVLSLFKSSFNKEYFEISTLKKTLYKEKLYGYNELLKYKSSNKIFLGSIVDVKNDGKISLLVNDKIKDFEFGSLELLI